jgi:hypothetical protein
MPFQPLWITLAMFLSGLNDPLGDHVACLLLINAAIRQGEDVGQSLFERFLENLDDAHELRRQPRPAFGHVTAHRLSGRRQHRLRRTSLAQAVRIE